MLVQTVHRSALRPQAGEELHRILIERTLMADNGGLTLTHALLASNPAIDAGDNAVCPATDQRGVARDAACDVGSFEYVP
jgi:hypothetical protein